MKEGLERRLETLEKDSELWSREGWLYILNNKPVLGPDGKRYILEEAEEL